MFLSLVLVLWCVGNPLEAPEPRKNQSDRKVTKKVTFGLPPSNSNPENPYTPNLGGGDSPPKFGGRIFKKYLFYSVFWREIWGWNLHPPNLGGVGSQGKWPWKWPQKWLFDPQRDSKVTFRVKKSLLGSLWGSPESHLLATFRSLLIFWGFQGVPGITILTALN